MSTTKLQKGFLSIALLGMIAAAGGTAATAGAGEAKEAPVAATQCAAADSGAGLRAGLQAASEAPAAIRTAQQEA